MVNLAEKNHFIVLLLTIEILFESFELYITVLRSSISGFSSYVNDKMF